MRLNRLRPATAHSMVNFSESIMTDVNVRQADGSSLSLILDLYRAAGWWDENGNVAMVAKIVAGSFCFAVAERDGRIIGIGRVLSDGVSDAYLQDVFVLPDHRGAGVGSRIVEFLRDFCIARDLTWIALIANPGTAPFYSKLGFKIMEGHAPVLLLPNRRGKP